VKETRVPTVNYMLPNPSPNSPSKNSFLAILTTATLSLIISETPLTNDDNDIVSLPQSPLKLYCEPNARMSSELPNVILFGPRSWKEEDS
jgi:hypothetical protein